MTPFFHPRRDDLLVSLAGPAANLLVVIGSFIIWFGAIALGIEKIISSSTFDIIYNFFENIVFLNIVLFIFNLLPIPPLDGFHIAKSLFLNDKAREKDNSFARLFGLI